MTYLIANVIPNPEGAEDAQNYTSKVGEMLVQAGGKNAKRVKYNSSIKGDPLYHVMLVMEFPNKEAIDSVFESEAYKEIIPYRDNGFKMVNIQVFEDL